MRVIYYTRPAFLDLALPFARELSRQVELHLVLEVSPEQWSSGFLDLERLPLPSGVVAADAVLRDRFPAGVQAYWRDLASFNLVVYDGRRSIHPRAWWTSHRAARFMRHLRPSVIHLDDVSLRLAWALPELGPTPMVLSVHDPEPHRGEGHWRHDLARRLTFGHARTYVLHNRAQTESFCRRYRIAADRVRSLPLGVNEVYREWRHPGERAASDESPTVLFFGRVSRYKGLEILYQAIPRVAAAVPGVRFVIAGKPIPGYTPPSPPPIANGWPVEVISAYVSNDRLARLFRDATVVVCPYLDATQSAVVLTAFGFDKPVVATKVGGLPEYVWPGETGLLVPPGDPDALSTALVNVLTDAPLRRRLSEGIGRLGDGPLSWSSIARQAVETYQSCER